MAPSPPPSLSSPAAAAPAASSAVAGSTPGTMTGHSPPLSTAARPAAPPPAAFQNLPMSRGAASGNAAGHTVPLDGHADGEAKKKTKRRLSGDGADIAALADAAEANAAAVTSACPPSATDQLQADGGNGGRNAKRDRRGKKGKGKKKNSAAHAAADDLLSPLSSKSAGHHGKKGGGMASPTGLMPRSFASPPAAAASAVNNVSKESDKKKTEESEEKRHDMCQDEDTNGTKTKQDQTSPPPVQLERSNSMATAQSVGDGSLGYAADVSVPSSAGDAASSAASASSSVDAASAPSADASQDPSHDTGMDTGDSSGPYPVSSITDSYSYSGIAASRASSSAISRSSPATIAATSEEDEVARGVVKRMSQMRSATGGKVGAGDGNAKAKAVDGAENAKAGRKNARSLRQQQERQEAGDRREKLAAVSSSHLRSSNKTTLKPSNDGGEHPSSDWNHGRRRGRRNSDGPTSAVPYVTFGGDDQDAMSDAGLSSLHSDLALSGDSSFDGESLRSILESDISVAGSSEGGQKNVAEEDLSLGLEDLDEGHAVAAAAAYFSAMSGTAANSPGVFRGGTNGVPKGDSLDARRRSSYGEYSINSDARHNRTNLHGSMATIFSNGKTDKKSRGGDSSNKAGRNDRRGTATSPVPSSRSRRPMVRRSSSSNKALLNLRMNDSCASLLKSSTQGNRVESTAGSCTGSVGSGGRSSRGGLSGGGLSGISGLSLSSRSLAFSGAQEYADASLFENLDRNWMNGKSEDDPAAVAQVIVERMCLASFAIMFDGMGSGYPYKTYDAGILALSSSAGSSDGVGGLPSCDNIVLDGLNVAPPHEISGETPKNSSSPSSARGRVPIVPVAVVHRLWSDVVLPSLPEATSVVEGKKGKHGIKSVLDSIVRTLTNEMNFLTLVDVNGTKCLQLSHEMYADYGHFIAESYEVVGTPIEDTVTAWHAQFAKGLKKAILNGKVGSISDEIGLYAAVALPRHLLLSSKNTAECRDLLLDPIFVARRMVVFGCRLGGKSGPSKIKIEKITSHAVIRATQIHIADIDCVVEYADSEEEQAADVAELCAAWEAACGSILDATSKKPLDPQAKERQQERKKRRRAKHDEREGSTSKHIGEDSHVPDSVSTTGSSASESFVPGNDSAPEEFMHVSEDHRKKASNRRVRSKKSEKGQKKVSFTFDSPEGPLPRNAPEDDYPSDDASTLTGLTGSGASKALRDYASRNAFADDATVESGASVGITLRDVLNIDLGITKREAAIGKSLYLLSRSLRSTVEDAESQLPRASVHDAARLQIKLLAKCIELYASIVSKLSYLLSEDLDMIEEDDLAEMLLFETKFGENAGAMASKRLQRLHDDRREARSLMTTIQLMSVEAWYCLGGNLMRASESGALSSLQLSDVGLLDRIGLGGEIEGGLTGMPPIDEMDSVFGGDDTTVATSSGDSFATSATSLHSAHTKAISCFRIAFSLLVPLEKPNPRAPNANVGFYKEELKAAILHEFGLYQFEQRGDMDSAISFFSKSISTRKSFLQMIQDDEVDGIGRMKSSTVLSRGHMSSSSIRTLGSRGSDRSAVSSFVDGMAYVLPSVGVLKRRIPSIEAALSSTLEYAALTEHSLNDFKASLAYFQEAMILRATHAGKNSLDVASLQFNMGVVHDDAGEYEASLNRYSESLRIRMQYLEQILYESDADSYNSDAVHQKDDVNDLEITVILTLKCMGNVYRAVNEPGSALECYLSAIDTLDRNMVRFGSLAPGLDHMHLVDGISSSIPLPEFILPEMRADEKLASDAQATISAADASREELARNAANGRSGINLNDTKSMSDVDRILREMTNMYSVVIRLIDLKKEQEEVGSDAPEFKLSASAKVFNVLSSNRARSSTFSSTKSVGSLSRSTYLWSRGGSGGEDVEDDESILLTAAYNLGKLYMHFGQYESSIEFLEHCLRTLWALNSSDGSSGSYYSDDDDDYSDMSSSFGSSSRGRSARQSGRKQRRRRSLSASKPKIGHRSAVEMIEEGAVFHLMAKAHAALSDHHRAVRCFVTGLRHYRRDDYSDDWKLAGALYDCGLSYWRLEDYSAARKCWSDCLIHLDDINDVVNLKGKRALVRKTRLANVLYNLASSNCALGQYEDDSTTQYLLEASDIYRGLYIERDGAPEAHQVGHCYFYLALIEYKHACGARRRAFAAVTPLKMDSVEGQEVVISQDSSSVISGADDKSSANADNKQKSKDWGGRLKDALDYLAKAQNIYDSHLDILDQSEIRANRFVKADKKDLWGIFHPMQAHISHLSGLSYDKLGLFDKASKEYASALRLSNILYGPSNVHSASIMHRMGALFGAMEHYGTSLKCYGDSLTMRTAVLGLNNEATADTLFDFAGLHARLDHYEAAIKAYDDCLKIRMQTEGLYGMGVVKALTNTGIVHARYGMYERARDCLSGALKVSKDRVEQRKASFEVTNTKSSLDYASVSDYTNDDTTQQKIYELAQEKRELASILHHIANVHFKLNDSKRALSCFEEALRIRRWLCGHSEGNASMIELAHQDFEEASDDLELAYRQFFQERAPKNYHSEEDLDVLADTLHSMGCVYEASKQLESALRCYNESLIIKRRSSVYCAGDMQQIALAGDSKFGAAHPESLSYAKTLIRIGCVQSKLSNHEIALSHLEPGLRLQRRHLGRDHPNVAQTLAEMGRCLRQRSLNTTTRAGSHRGSSDIVALKCYNEALRISKLRFGPQHVVVAGILYDRGSVLDSVGDFSEAAACYKQSLRVYGRHYAHGVLTGLLRTGPTNSSLTEDDELGDASYDPSDPFASLLFAAQDGTTDKEQYLRASAAFRQSILRSRETDGSSVGGIVCVNVCSKNDGCLTWFELLFFQLFELAGQRLIDPVRSAISNTIAKAIEDIDQAGAQAIVTATDINYNFLYLIQE